jgi:hypothetical protein
MMQIFPRESREEKTHFQGQRVDQAGSR